MGVLFMIAIEARPSTLDAGHPWSDVATFAIGKFVFDIPWKTPPAVALGGLHVRCAACAGFVTWRDVEKRSDAEAAPLGAQEQVRVCGSCGARPAAVAYYDTHGGKWASREAYDGRELPEIDRWLCGELSISVQQLQQHDVGIPAGFAPFPLFEQRAQESDALAFLLANVEGPIGYRALRAFLLRLLPKMIESETHEFRLVQLIES